jgi:hypothetical protein
MKGKRPISSERVSEGFLVGGTREGFGESEGRRFEEREGRVVGVKAEQHKGYYEDDDDNDNDNEDRRASK